MQDLYHLGVGASCNKFDLGLQSIIMGLLCTLNPG